MDTWDATSEALCNAGLLEYCDSFPSVIPPRVHTPSGTVTGGGFQINNTVLDKTLNAILSGLALLKGAQKIPTTLDPQSGYGSGGYDPATLAYLQQQSLGSKNTAGNLQQFLEQNKGAVIIAGIVAVAFFMKPPTRKNGLLKLLK